MFLAIFKNTYLETNYNYNLYKSKNTSKIYRNVMELEMPLIPIYCFCTKQKINNINMLNSFCLVHLCLIFKLTIMYLYLVFTSLIFIISHSYHLHVIFLKIKMVL